jgi:hypothetical protein
MWTKLFPRNFGSEMSLGLKSTGDFQKSLYQTTFEPGSAKTMKNLRRGNSESVYLIDSELEKFVVKYYGHTSEDFSYLNRDYQILSLLYPDSHPKILKLEDGQFSYLQMNYLFSRDLSPLEAYLEQKNISSSLWKLENLIPRETCICEFFNYLYKEINSPPFLETSDDDSRRIIKYINIAREYICETEKVLVHGDFGPNNILHSEMGLIVIDWEDSFWSIPDYDYLYWLTFLGNRKFLTLENLDRSRYPIEVSIGVVLMIISLKEIIAKKSQLNNLDRIPAPERLRQALGILN